MNRKKKLVAVSGGFDPIHVGHVRMIPDEWLVRKKGYSFMPFEERAEIIEALQGVVAVVKASDDDGTVCESLREIVPDIFANGGDRKEGNTPEGEVCADLNIEMVWNVGGGKIQSSSWLVKGSKEK